MGVQGWERDWGEEARGVRQQTWRSNARTRGKQQGMRAVVHARVVVAMTHHAAAPASSPEATAKFERCMVPRSSHF